MSATTPESDVTASLITELSIDETVLDEAAVHLLTIRDWIRFSVTALREHEVHIGQGTEDVFAEANALVLQSLSLDWNPDEQILDSRLLPTERRRIVELLKARINQRRPLAYLLNLTYFCGQPYYVDERVLIPRSPIAELIDNRFAPYFTDGLVDSAQPLPDGVNRLPRSTWPKHAPSVPSHIMDLCTGSGCIAIALAYAFPEAQVDALDLSRDALAVAALNIDHHQMQEQVNLFESDLFDRLPAQQQYDLIVSNPPYVDAAEMADLPPEFNHEPELALAAGRDGLDLVRRILAQAADYLSEHGLLVVEVGASAWALIQTYPDVDFHWLQFVRGGDGVFALTAAQCRECQPIFQQALAIS